MIIVVAVGSAPWQACKRVERAAGELAENDRRVE